MKKISRLARVVCLITVLAMLLSSCDLLGKFGTKPEDLHETCLDENLDHLCDVCEASLSECTDISGDHKCDLCQRVISTCTEIQNHCCIECGAVVTACIDEDRNHGCDVCNAPLSKCADGDNDHACDVCGKPLSNCADTNKNHECDLCAKLLSECEDGNLDHKCDVCERVCSECSDLDSDHVCDICGASLGDCRDADRDHVCDVCAADTGSCSDLDSDHKCDVCEKILSECINEDNDHFCDICKLKLTNCIDSNNDHACDVCTQILTVCTDISGDHKCDVCFITLSVCKDESVIDHKCDVCSATLSECEYVDRVCTVCGNSTIYKHVVIVGVDGAGSFFKDTDTPNMDKIFADGAITYTGITETPSISAECWTSLMHGVNASVHGVSASSPAPYPNDSEFPSFFRVIRENDPDAVLGSYTTWQTINNLIVEDGIGITKVGWSGTDADLTVKICQYVKSSAPTALFIQFDNVDAAGHENGFGSAAHLNKITETDALIGQIYDAYTERGIIDDTLFIVTTDHGGTQVSSGSYLGNHGGETAEEKQITFAAKGKTVVKGGNIEGFEIRDTAAIVLYALGYENAQPETWTARVPSGLFEGVTATDRPVGNQPTDPDLNATPKPGDEGYVTNYVTDKNLITYLTFDGDCDDVCGTSTTVNKTVTYQDGYFGQGAVLNAGYITLNDFNVGTDSFTATMWVKTAGIKGDPVLLGNKDWKASGTNPGLILALHDPVAGYKENDYFIANFADGATRVDLRPDLPLNFKDGYFHVAVIFDRENDKLSVVFNFTTITTMDIPASLKNATAESLLPLNIGQDGTGAYTSPLNATVDEFMIFDGAFSSDNLASLKSYYDQRVEQTPDVEEVLTKEIITHLTFDRTTADATGNYETVPTKSPTYGAGYLGNAMQLNGNSVTVKDLELGTGSITFSTWVYISGTNGGDPALFGNKDWNSGNNAGILVCPHTNGTLIVNFSDGTSAGRVDLKPSYPTDMYNRWMHLLVVIDKEACELRVSFDFGDFISVSLGEGNKNAPLDGNYDLVIGQDGTTSYKDNGNIYLKGYIDEFIIFDGALDKTDLAYLKEYYTKA